MLSITTTAERAIRGILDSPEAPEEAGIRIETTPSADGTEAGFQLAVVPEPGAGDEVLAEGSVFVERQTAELLEQSELDADISQDGVRFKLQPQQG